ncbi:uncharacterized protein [Nicotiana sylvestris]|uniref:uncharacterized protein n=1 Tax=Nicotiana sylvestris TaxID=4096 RepID=UPI00388C88BA
MAAPPNFKEVQSTYTPPRFNGQYYGWWKTRMHDFIMAEDSELWDVICDGPYIPTKANAELPFSMPKTRKEYTDAERKAVEKKFCAKKILVCGIGPDEYNIISACETVKEIWEALQTAHEETTQVKQSKIDMLTTENKLVRKILSILPSSWESKVNAITEVKDLQELTIDEMVGNLNTYEMKRKIESERREPKKEKNQRKKRTWCGKPGHFIKDYPLLKQEYSKYNPEKASKRNPALTTWGDSSSESEDETDVGDSSMMVVESEENEYDSIFALMAQSDDDEDDDNSEDKDALTLELGEAKQTRDNLVVCVVDLKETICELEKEKFVLTKKIANIEHERDNLVVVVVDHKETIENFRKEREALMKRVTEIEEERDDLLVVIVDLRETIEGLWTESKPRNSGKRKEVASEEHIRLENELKAMRTSLCVESEKNKHLYTELERIKNNLEKSLKWTWSSEAITAIYVNKGGNRQGIGFQREKTPYNPQSKYVTVSDNWLCTHCGNNRHFKENCQARVQSFQKNKVFVENVTTKKGPGSTHKKRILPGTVKGSSQQWFMDSGCSKHMTGNTMDFLSLKALQGRSVSFGSGKKGYILGVGKVGKSLTHSIENVYYVNGLKYSLLSVSQICDKGNKVEFLSKICTVTNLVAVEVVLVAKRYKNIYVSNFESIQSGDLSCLKAVDDDAELLHRRLGHASFSLLNKLIQKDLVHGLPMSKFKVQKVCDACARRKHVKSSFKSKKDVSTSKPLDLLHMDLCGPMRMQSRG